MKKALIVFVVILLSWSFLFGQKSPESILARVGDVFISESEFLQRFETLPGPNRTPRQIEKAKADFLYSLVAEKLLAQAAVERRLDEDSSFQAALLDIRKLFARDELYREEITRNVSISTSELRESTKRALKELHISYIYLPDSASAGFLRAQMKSQKDFTGMVLDTSFGGTKDTVTIAWGEAEPALEHAAYSLKDGEVSQPVRAGEGWYIFSVTRRAPNPAYTGLSASVLQERVAEKLRKRKEGDLTNQYLADFLSAKKAVSSAELFHRFSQEAVLVFQKYATDSLVLMSTSIVDELRSNLSSILKDTLVHTDTVSWTVDDVIQRLYTKGFFIERDGINRLPSRLNSQIREWVHQEFLAQEGLRQKLDERPSVKREIEMWQQSMLAAMMRAYVLSKIRPTDVEVWSYLKGRNPGQRVPQVRIRELITQSEELMITALEELREGRRFINVIEKYSMDPGHQHNQGASNYFPITERSPIGEIAWQLNVGERFGPIKSDSSFIYFELLDKKEALLDTDTASSSRFRQAFEELSQQKSQQTLPQFIAQLAEQRGVDFYEEPIRQLKVSPIPMMTFRFLGFGGRMFAAPFVDRQVEWVNVEPPSISIIP